MVRYLCQSCNSTYVDKHKCFFYKNYDNVYSPPEQDKLDEKDAKNDEAKDEFTANSNDEPRKLCPAVELSDTEELEQANFSLAKNNEQVAFISALKTKREFRSLSDETSDNAQHGNPQGALVSCSTLNVQENEVHSEEKDSFKSSGNFGPHYRFENGIRGVCTRNSAALYEQKNGETRYYASVYEAFSEEYEKLLERKWQLFTDDEMFFIESSDGDTENDLSDSKDISETDSTAFSPDDKESDKYTFEVSRDLLDTRISPEVFAPALSTRGMTAKKDNLKESLISMKDASPLSEPSGIRAILLQAEKRPFACDLCYKRFSLKSTLKKHYRTHTGEKPFICDKCDKAFAHKITLDIHYRKHTGEKPFICHECRKAFTQKITLKNHYRTHTGEKPFVCDVCKKCFAYKISLTTHVRTHTGEKPYKCEVCEKAFSQSGTRNTHYKLIHK